MGVKNNLKEQHDPRTGYCRVVLSLCRISLSLSGFGVFLIIWHFAVLQLPIQSLLPTPIGVARALQSMWSSGQLTQDIQESFNRIFIGFLCALIAAFILGILAACFGRFYDGIKMTIELLGSIPPIAWTPLAILWFGIGNMPAYFIVFLGAFFPMFTNIYSGITGVNADFIKSARTLGASKWFITRKVIFPAALPQSFIGIRSAIGVAWFNVIAAELIGVRSGLGYKIQLNRTLLDSESVVALMLVIGVLGFCMTRFTIVIGNLMAPWAIQDASRSRWRQFRRFVGHFFSVPTFFRYFANTTNQNEICFSIALSPPHPQPKTGEDKNPILQVEEVSKSFETSGRNQYLQVLHDVSFEVRNNEIFCIIGPNGSGKTTLLNLLAGLEGPDTGKVYFRGEEIASPSPQRTLIFQNLALFPWMTCYDNIEFALRAPKGHKERGRKEKRIVPFPAQVTTLLKQTKLETFADSYPDELSGGMKQRLALARALAAKPEVILMDEPFASFDPIVRAKSQQTILDILSETSVTILLVTHDLDEAIFMADRILVLSDRPGKVKEVLQVTLPHPRRDEMRQWEDFQKLRLHLWNVLRNTEGQNNVIQDS